MSARAMLSRLLVLLLGIAVALALAEILLRQFGREPRVLGQLSFRDRAGQPVGEPGDLGGAMAAARQAGMVEDLPPDQTPRPRARFAPGAQFWMCYGDNDVLRRDWLDARGCVEVRINRFGLREREEITPDNKGADERRVVCIGDSFTFGWGIPVEQCWVRLLEQELRATNGNVRTVNCGASGAICVDEYAWGLRTRFGAFRPDVVLVTICLNDLIPSSGLFVQGPRRRPTGLQLWDRLVGALGPGPLDLDPEQPWVDVLLGLKEAEGTAAELYGPDKPFSAMWSQGAPQKSLVEMRDWCAQHGATLLVAVWPFLQGLGPGRSYPFAKLHRMLAEFCAGERIPCLDLQPVLQPARAEELWVTPADMHANPRAQHLALPALVPFVRSHLGR